MVATEQTTFLHCVFFGITVGDLSYVGLSVGSLLCLVSPFVCFYASCLLLFVSVCERVSIVYVYMYVMCMCVQRYEYVQNVYMCRSEVNRVIFLDHSPH